MVFIKGLAGGLGGLSGAAAVAAAASELPNSPRGDLPPPHPDQGSPSFNLPSNNFFCMLNRQTFYFPHQ